MLVKYLEEVVLTGILGMYFLFAPYWVIRTGYWAEHFPKQSIQRRKRILMKVMEFCVAKGAVKKHRQVTLQIGQIKSWRWLYDTKLY